MDSFSNPLTGRLVKNTAQNRKRVCLAVLNANGIKNRLYNPVTGRIVADTDKNREYLGLLGIPVNGRCTEKRPIYNSRSKRCVTASPKNRKAAGLPFALA